MKKAKNAFIRTLSLLLALVIVLSIPISALATETNSADPYAVSTAAFQYDAERALMMSHSVFRALMYLGYDAKGNPEETGFHTSTAPPTHTDDQYACFFHTKQKYSNFPLDKSCICAIIQKLSDSKPNMGV